MPVSTPRRGIQHSIRFGRLVYGTAVTLIGKTVFMKFPVFNQSSVGTVAGGRSRIRIQSGQELTGSATRGTLDSTHYQGIQRVAVIGRRRRDRRRSCSLPLIRFHASVSGSPWVVCQVHSRWTQPQRGIKQQMSMLTDFPCIRHRKWAEK